MLRHMLLSGPKRTYAEDILILNEAARGERVEVPVGRHVPAGAPQQAECYLMPIALPEGSSEMGRLETRSLPILQASARAAAAPRPPARRAPRLTGSHRASAAVRARAPLPQAIQRGFGTAYDLLAPEAQGRTGAEEAMRVFPDELAVSAAGRS